MAERQCVGAERPAGPMTRRELIESAPSSAFSAAAAAALPEHQAASPNSTLDAASPHSSLNSNPGRSGSGSRDAVLARGGGSGGGGGGGRKTVLGTFACFVRKAFGSSGGGSSRSDGGAGEGGYDGRPTRASSRKTGSGRSCLSCHNTGPGHEGGEEKWSGGSLSAMPSGVVTDLTRLPEAWNMVEFDQLELIRIIGEGSFGQVWLAKYCQTPVAVKMLTPQRMLSLTSSMQERATMRQLSKEVGIMSQLRHPNCVQYLGMCLEPPVLVLEYCARKSVDGILAGGLTDPKMARQLTWARLLGLACDAAKGMLYLHSRHIVHRDLKSANLLVDAHWHCKVADFNLSKAAEVNSMTSTINITNPRWLAPEVLRGGQAQMPGDVWAFGTVMWELMTWNLPFSGMNPFQIITLVTSEEGSGLAIPPPDKVPAGAFANYSEYVDLMRSCWAHEPGARPTMDVVIARLLPMLRAELRRSSIADAGSGTLGPPTPYASEELPTSQSVATEGGASARSSAVATGEAGSPAGQATARPPPGPSATQKLLAEGRVTVGTAGLSQQDSGSKHYPFVNTDSFFYRQRAELLE